MPLKNSNHVQQKKNFKKTVKTDANIPISEKKAGYIPVSAGLTKMKQNQSPLTSSNPNPTASKSSKGKKK
jgi:hypothetical protein